MWTGDGTWVGPGYCWTEAASEKNVTQVIYRFFAHNFFLHTAKLLTVKTYFVHRGQNVHFYDKTTRNRET